MNKIIKAFLDEGKITQDEYDILFVSKEYHTNTTFFKSTLKKIIILQQYKDSIELEYIHFPAISYKDINYSNKEYSFDNCTFWGELNFKFETIPNKISFTFSIFKMDATFFNTNFLNKIYFENVEFIKRCNFNGAKLKNLYICDSVLNYGIELGSTICEEEVYFSDNIYYSSSEFLNAKFNDTLAFINCNFTEELSLANIHVNQLFEFWNNKIYKVDFLGSALGNIVFENNLNIEDNSSLNQNNFKNKESASLIKTHFEKQNNITEANKYFVIEKELYLQKINDKNSFEPNRNSTKFVLYLNKYVSNFGTDWIRPLLVIFIFGYLSSLGYGFLQEGTENINFTSSKLLLFSAFLYSLLVYYFYHKQLWVAWVASIFVFFSLLMGEIHLREISNDISKLINPLNIFKSNASYFESIALYGMLVKLSMSVLIYQFIMAFRQNTRRK